MHLGVKYHFLYHYIFLSNDRHLATFLLPSSNANSRNNFSMKHELYSTHFNFFFPNLLSWRRYYFTSGRRFHIPKIHSTLFKLTKRLFSQEWMHTRKKIMTKINQNLWAERPFFLFTLLPLLLFLWFLCLILFLYAFRNLLFSHLICSRVGNSFHGSLMAAIFDVKSRPELFNW